MSFFKFQKLFISLFAVIAVFLAAGHFCSAFSMSSHHAAEPSGTIEISDNASYQQCCMDKAKAQLTASTQQVQKFVVDPQNIIAAAFYTLPISTAVANSGFSTPTPAESRPNPGGFILRC